MHDIDIPNIETVSLHFFMEHQDEMINLNASDNTEPEPEPESEPIICLPENTVNDFRLCPTLHSILDLIARFYLTGPQAHYYVYFNSHLFNHKTSLKVILKYM